MLGEYATSNESVDTAMAAYLDCMKQIQENQLKASISIKLSALGAVIDPDLCQLKVVELAREAQSRGIGFEIDMEGKQLVDLTIQTAKLCATGGAQTTLAIQAYLKRTLDDLDDLQGQANLRIRLVKGSYIGDVAPRLVDESYKLLVEALVYLNKPYCVATHDPELLNWMKLTGIVDTTKTEFSFLKGLADKTKLALVESKLIVSEYVPFGKESGSYIARRLRYLHNLEESHKSPAP